MIGEVAKVSVTHPVLPNSLVAFLFMLDREPYSTIIMRNLYNVNVISTRELCFWVHLFVRLSVFNNSKSSKWIFLNFFMSVRLE